MRWVFAPLREWRIGCDGRGCMSQTSEERAARRRVSEQIHSCFACPKSERKKAWKALLAFRPGRREGKRLRLTYIDLFHYIERPFLHLDVADQPALMPETIDFILRDKDFGEDEWSGMLFLGHALCREALREACTPRQKQALVNFIEYLMKHRVVRHGCGVFMDQFERALNRWRS